MKVHHIGYAVHDLEKSVTEFKKLNYRLHGTTVIDEKRKVAIQFMCNGETLIELIAAIHETSPVQGILMKLGDTPYHICYETKDICAEIERLEKERFMLLDKPTQAVAINNRKVAFLYKKGIGILELVEY